jgi:hypothetical protein
VVASYRWIWQTRCPWSERVEGGQSLDCCTALPAIDFATVYRYEEDDRTTTVWELACSGGVCEIDM